MALRDLLTRVFCFLGLHQYQLRSILHQLKIATCRATQGVTELAIRFESGLHRVVLELRGNKLSVMGVSDLVIERREIPTSVSVALLQRNVSLTGCAWALLSYEHLKMFIVSSQIDLRLCNTRRFGKVLEAVLQELEFCRENLARVQ